MKSEDDWKSREPEPGLPLQPGKQQERGCLNSGILLPKPIGTTGECSKIPNPAPDQLCGNLWAGTWVSGFLKAPLSFQCAANTEDLYFKTKLNKSLEELTIPKCIFPCP